MVEKNPLMHTKHFEFGSVTEWKLRELRDALQCLHMLNISQYYRRTNVVKKIKKMVYNLSHTRKTAGQNRPKQECMTGWQLQYFTEKIRDWRREFTMPTTKWNPHTDLTMWITGPFYHRCFLTCMPRHGHIPANAPTLWQRSFVDTFKRPSNIV